LAAQIGARIGVYVSESPPCPGHFLLQLRRRGIRTEAGQLGTDRPSRQKRVDRRCEQESHGHGRSVRRGPPYWAIKLMHSRASGRLAGSLVLRASGAPRARRREGWAQFSCGAATRSTSWTSRARTIGPRRRGLRPTERSIGRFAKGVHRQEIKLWPQAHLHINGRQRRTEDPIVQQLSRAMPRSGFQGTAASQPRRRSSRSSREIGRPFFWCHSQAGAFGWRRRRQTAWSGHSRDRAQRPAVLRRRFRRCARLLPPGIARP